MASNKIMVTVTVPEGLRAVVDMSDNGAAKHLQQAIVTGGQTQEFFVDSIRRTVVREGLPHCMTDALDRKPDSE